MKLVSCISAFILVLGLVVTGVLAASGQTITMNGSVNFNVTDRSLWVNEVRMQETGEDPVVISKFTPGYINGDFNFNVGDHENSRGSFALYFDIINTTTNNYTVSLSVPVSFGTNNIETSITESISASESEIATITIDTPITTTLTLVVANPNLIDINLRDITINIEEQELPTAASSFTFSFNDTNHTATITDFIGSETEVVIPSTVSKASDGTATEGNDYTVTTIIGGGYGGAFANCKNITSVIIPEGVTSIGMYAFLSCRNLTSITIPASATSFGQDPFSSCTAIAEVYSYSSVATAYFSLAKIVYNPSDLAEGKPATRITVVDNIQYYNYGDDFIALAPAVARETLSEVTLDNRTTEINQFMFCDSSNLTSITIPSNVTSIGDNAFNNCSSLFSITIPSSVTSIGDRTFYNCSSLTSIEVDSANTNYSSEGGVLFNKDKTRLIQYPIGKTSTSYTITAGISSIASMAFFNCSSLNDITVESDDIYLNLTSQTACGYLITYVDATGETVRVLKSVVDSVDPDFTVNTYLNGFRFTRSVSEDGLYYIYTRN